MTAPGHTYNVVYLDFMACPHAKPALDAGIKVHAHCDMAVIKKRYASVFELGEAALIDTIGLGHVPKMACFVMGCVAIRLISK